MIIQIEEMPKQRIAYIRQVGPYGLQNGSAMERLKNWAASKYLFSGSAIILGIAHDDPGITLPEQCRYDVCIVIPHHYKIQEVDRDIQETELSGGKYAVFPIEHTVEALQKAWADIFPELSSCGHLIDTTRSMLERYIPDMLQNNLCEICVPILG